MPTVDVPYPTSNNPGSAPGEGAGRLINCYAYQDNGAPRWRPVPGLDAFAPIPSGEVRGAFFDIGLVLAVVGNQVVRIDGGGGLVYLEGSVPGDGPVTIARNNALDPTIAITTSNGTFVVENGVVKNYPDTNLPQVNSVSFLDGYLLWTTSAGRIYASGLNTTTVDPLSFTTAEARPDGLLRGITYGQQYFAMGADTIEVYQDAATLPFPLARSSVIPIGLIGPWAVAGYEDGWGGPLIFVAEDNSVRRLDGYTPTRISNEDLEQLIARVPNKSTLRASIYTFGGNAIWSLSSPNWTWEHNVTTGSWHERESYGFSRWRGGATIRGFGKWIIADIDGGLMYALNPDTRAEGPSPLIWGMDSGPVKQFPVRIAVPVAYHDFVLGQAPISTKPEVLLSWSHDGGARWANPISRSLGMQGQSVGRVSVNRMGLTSHHGTRLRFRVSDPAYSSFTGSRMEATARR